MTKLNHAIWFPSHGGNKGIISKIFKETLAEELHGLQYTLERANFEGDDLFLFELEIGSEDQETYIKNKLITRFGESPKTKKLQKGDVIPARIGDPNQVGFGIFCKTKFGADVLLPLYELRKLVDNKTVPARRISDAYGFVENFPLELKVDEIERGKTKMIFSDNQTAMFEDWMEDGVERVITSMTYTSDVKAIVKQLDLDKYIDHVYDIDPLTTIIVCNPRTRGSGLLPIIGSKLHSVPIGIFRPKKIEQLMQDS